MATLLDTSALVVLVRKRRASGLEPLARAAREEIAARRVAVSSVTVTELLVGARSGAGARALRELLDHVPTVGADREVAERAAELGALARRSGSVIPLADLLIAATALWLDLSLLTCDSDFGRARRLDPELRLHPASVVG